MVRPHANKYLAFAGQATGEPQRNKRGGKTACDLMGRCLGGVAPRARAGLRPTARPKKKKKRPAGDGRDAEGGRAFFFLRRRRPARFHPAFSSARERARATNGADHLFIYLLFLSLPRKCTRKRRRFYFLFFYFYFYLFSAQLVPRPLSRCDLAWVAARFFFFFTPRAQTLLGGSRRRAGPAGGDLGNKIRGDLGRGLRAAERDGACRGFVRNPKPGMKWYLTCKVAGWIPQI